MNYIFYFSGTGNTLDIGRRIEKKLDNTELINIAKMSASKFRIDKADTVGFLFPVYAFRYPLMFDSIIERITLIKCNYIYTIAIHGGSPYGAVHLFNKALEKHSINVDASFELKTPDNYLVALDPPSAEESNKILSVTYSELDEVIRKIESNIPSVISTLKSQKIIGNLLAKTLKNYASKQASKFSVTNKCNGCSICSRVCPKQIITINSSKHPEWNGRECEMCFSCINLCPQKAIESGKKTVGRNRYVNPQINLKDMFVR